MEIKITPLEPYINNCTKILCRCDVCGHTWMIKPNNIFSGFGCPECGRKKNVLKRTKTLEKFLEQCYKVHGDFYDYSKVVYVNDATPVTIICPKHGEFLVTPSNHLRGHKCYKCMVELVHDNQRRTNELFVQKSKEKFGDRFTYDRCEYKGSFEPVIITCRDHGDFEVLAYRHLQSEGCPKCHKSNGEHIVEEILEKNHIEFVSQFNIKYKNFNMFCDFYIPHKNLIIEYLGRLHYVPIDHFGGNDKFSCQQLRDMTLREYCLKNQIYLCEIPYLFNKDEILDLILNYYNYE